MKKVAALALAPCRGIGLTAPHCFVKSVERRLAAADAGEAGTQHRHEARQCLHLQRRLLPPVLLLCGGELLLLLLRTVGGGGVAFGAGGLGDSSGQLGIGVPQCLLCRFDQLARRLAAVSFGNIRQNVLVAEAGVALPLAGEGDEEGLEGVLFAVRQRGRRGSSSGGGILGNIRGRRRRNVIRGGGDSLVDLCQRGADLLCDMAQVNGAVAQQRIDLAVRQHRVVIGQHEQLWVDGDASLGLCCCRRACGWRRSGWRSGCCIRRWCCCLRGLRPRCDAAFRGWRAGGDSGGHLSARRDQINTRVADKLQKSLGGYNEHSPVGLPRRGADGHAELVGVDAARLLAAGAGVRHEDNLDSVGANGHVTVGGIADEAGGPQCFEGLRGLLNEPFRRLPPQRPRLCRLRLPPPLRNA